MKTCLHCDTTLLTEWAKSGNAKYCSVKCQKAYEKAQFLIRWKDGTEQGKKGKFGISTIIREYLFQKYNHQCAKCGWNRINPATGKCPLEINHIDGNWENNLETNLELICPNCHALEPTFRALNKGKGRYSIPGSFNPGNGKIKKI